MSNSSLVKKLIFHMIMNETNIIQQNLEMRINDLLNRNRKEIEESILKRNEEDEKEIEEFLETCKTIIYAIAQISYVTARTLTIDVDNPKSIFEMSKEEREALMEKVHNVARFNTAFIIGMLDKEVFISMAKGFVNDSVVESDAYKLADGLVNLAIKNVYDIVMNISFIPFSDNSQITRKGIPPNIYS